MKHIIFFIAFITLSHRIAAARTLTDATVSSDDMMALVGNLPPDVLANITQNMDPANIPQIQADIASGNYENIPKLANVSATDIPELAKAANVSGIPNIPNLSDFKVSIPDIALPPMTAPKAKIPSVKEILNQLRVPAFITNSLLNKTD